MTEEISGTITAYFEDTSLYEKYIEDETDRIASIHRVIDGAKSISDRLNRFLDKNKTPDWTKYRFYEINEKAGLMMNCRFRIKEEI